MFEGEKKSSNESYSQRPGSAKQMRAVAQPDRGSCPRDPGWVNISFGVTRVTAQTMTARRVLQNFLRLPALATRRPRTPRSEPCVVTWPSKNAAAAGAERGGWWTTHQYRPASLVSPHGPALVLAPMRCSLGIL